jgi:hypothetical protein
MRRSLKVLIIALAVGAVFALGRIAAGHDRGYDAGLRDGEAQGVREGRAYQVTQALPEDMKGKAEKVFDTGYAAGQNDAFGGFDGGWGLAEPYVISLDRGRGSVTYRIASRTPLQEGTAYFLCPRSHALCTGPHPG